MTPFGTASGIKDALGMQSGCTQHAFGTGSGIKDALGMQSEIHSACTQSAISMKSACTHRHTWILCELIEEILAEDVFHSPVGEEDRDLQIARLVGDKRVARLEHGDDDR